MPLPAHASTGAFAGSISFLSYKFEDGGSYKKVLHNIRTRPLFHQQVLVEGQRLAHQHGRASLYEGISKEPFCFWLSEYFHNRYRFDALGEPNQQMVLFSTADLRLLQDANKLQLLLPFYKISFYIEKIHKYLIFEDDTSCLFLTDGIVRLFAAFTIEIPEFARFSSILLKNMNNPCLITVAKSSYLYDPLLPVEPVFA